MPRKNRTKSTSGVYHIISRGVSRQNIFYDKKDYNKYFAILEETKEKHPFKLYAFCLMGNHVHLMMREEADISKIMQTVNLRYATYFNKKYERNGHLFQDRFMSEVVEEENYFYTLLCYIHYNPIKAGLCNRMEDYPYSSYRSYFMDCYAKEKELLEISNHYNQMSREDLYILHSAYSEQHAVRALDMEKEYVRQKEGEAFKWISVSLAYGNPQEFLQKTKKEQLDLLNLYKEKGINLKQISRITGMSYNQIRYLNQKLENHTLEPSLKCK